MSQIKLTKNELRGQQIRLAQFEKYLPTLQLKKAMLQAEVLDARNELEAKGREQQEAIEAVQTFRGLLNEQMPLDMGLVSKVREIHKRYENVAGVEIPLLEGIDFEPFEYSLYDTPAWVEGAVLRMRGKEEAVVAYEIAVEKKEALERELREVSIRVNLFEKVLIPRAQANIKKIKIFLGDQQLSAVSQAKVAKTKILMRKASR